MALDRVRRSGQADRGRPSSSPSPVPTEPGLPGSACPFASIAPARPFDPDRRSVAGVASGPHGTEAQSGYGLILGGSTGFSTDFRSNRLERVAVNHAAPGLAIKSEQDRDEPVTQFRNSCIRPPYAEIRWFTNRNPKRIKWLRRIHEGFFDLIPRVFEPSFSKIRSRSCQLFCTIPRESSIYRWINFCAARGRLSWGGAGFPSRRHRTLPA